MSTTPAPVLAATTATPVLTVSKISSYLKLHEGLIALALVVGLVWFLSGRVTTAIANHDQKVYDAATAALKAQADKNAALAASNATAAAEFQQQAAQAQAANAKLEQQTVSLLAQLAQQKATDKNLPPPELAQRITTLAGLSTGAIVPAPNETFILNQSGAVGIATTLENVPVLETQIKNVQAEKANTDSLLATQTSLVGGLHQQITGLQVQIADGTKQCAAQVAVLKAVARKSKRKWFIAGYVAGLATRGAVRLFAGF